MYSVRVEVKESPIDGKGVFALADIRKNQPVWQFTSGHDVKIKPEEFNKLPADDRGAIQPTAYLSPTSGCWVFPPTGDPACFTNHSKNNNLTAKFDPKFSEEPYFIAKRDIKAGEELTNNYLEFDEFSQKLKADWLKK